MKKSKLCIVTAILSAILIVGAVLAAVGGSTIIKDRKLVKSAETRTALVTTVMLKDGSRKYVLWYNVDGVNYEIDYDFNKDNNDYVGKDITVYFTKDAPEDIFIATEKAYFVILYVGICLTVIAIILLCLIYIPICLHKYIVKNGRTELVRINEIVDVIGGQKIICDSTKIRGKNGTPYKSSRVGRKVSNDVINSAVNVYYLPDNKHFYYIDTSTIKFKEGDE